MKPAALSTDAYRGVVEHSPVLIWRSDALGACDYFNERWLAFTGRALADELGDGWADGVHPDDLAACLARYRDALARREPFEMRYRLRRSDGAYRWLQDRGVPYADAQGGFAGFLGTCLDVTELVEAQEACRRSELRLEALVRLGELSGRPRQEVMDFGLEEAVRLTGSRLGYLYFYDEATELFTLYSWSSSALAECAIADKQRVYELARTGLWGEAVRQRRPIAVNDFAAPHPWKRGYPEGHVRLTRFLTVPIVQDGRIVAVVGVGNKGEPYDDRDVWQLQLYLDQLWSIVERQRVDEALRASEERYRRLIETLPHGVEELDVDGHILFCNPALERIMGCAPGTLLGRHVFDLMEPAQDRAAMGAYWADLVARQPPPTPYVGRNLTRDGRLIDVLVDWDYARAPDGSLRGFVAVVTDVTARTRAEGLLRESEGRYRAVVQDQTEVICRFLPDGTFTFVSDVYCRVFGKTSEELLGQRWQPVAVPEDLPEIEGRLGDLSPAHPVITVENRVHTAQQGIRWMQFVNRGFFDAEGRLTEIQSVGRDVTAQRAASEREAQYQRRLQRLASELSLAEERERRKLAAELHDTVAQGLAVAKMRLGALKAACRGRRSLEEATEAEALVAQALRDTRALLFELGPPVLYHLGLAAALERLTEESCRKAGLAWDFADDGRPKPLDEDLRVLLYQSVRELLANVAKHAKARSVDVRVWESVGRVWVQVADDGVGTDPPGPALPGRDRGFGLFSIRERLRLYGGEIQIEAAPGGGTRVLLGVPLPAREAG